MLRGQIYQHAVSSLVKVFVLRACGCGVVVERVVAEGIEEEEGRCLEDGVAEGSVRYA